MRDVKLYIFYLEKGYDGNVLFIIYDYYGNTKAYQLYQIGGGVCIYIYIFQKKNGFL